MSHSDTWTKLNPHEARNYEALFLLRDGMWSPGLFILSTPNKNERAWESASSCGCTHKVGFGEKKDLVFVMQRWAEAKFSPLAQLITGAGQSEGYEPWTTF